MSRKNYFLGFVLLIAFSLPTWGQKNFIIEKNINIREIQNPYEKSINELTFESAVIHPIFQNIPVVHFQIPIDFQIDSIQLFLFDKSIKPNINIPAHYSLEACPNYHYEIQKSGNEYYLSIFYKPFIKNIHGNFEALNSLKLMVTTYGNDKKLSTKGAGKWASNSVLATGDWYKLRINQSGVFKITGAQLSQMGISLSSLPVNNIRLYGNGGGMYPEANNAFFHDDLVENAIQVVDNNQNGNFDPDDFFLFYGQGPDIWKYDSGLKRFGHSKHLYDDYAYYFITLQSGNGKRITNLSQSTPVEDTLVTTFNDFKFYDRDSINLIKSGKQWFGDEYNIITNYSYNFRFPNLNSQKEVKIKYSVAGRSTGNSQMNFNVNGNTNSLAIPSIPGSYNSSYAQGIKHEFSYNLTNDLIQINASYQKGNSTSIAWMDYIEVNVSRHLIMSGKQMEFRNDGIVASGKVAMYLLANASSDIQIWEITDPTSVRNIDFNFVNNEIHFKQGCDSLRTFIAHNGEYKTPEYVAKIENQNLHGQSDIDYVICYHNKFAQQAEKLAQYHRDKGSLNVFTVDQNLLFNEFSGGAKDIAALRNFMKMLYDKANDSGKNPPKYLLLFGDASFDYKSRISNNTNYVLTFESSASLSPISSYSSDDFFGLLDDNEGANCNGTLDIGIGRFVVRTTAEAENAIEKIKRYEALHSHPTGDNSFTNTEIPNMADWRNILCFIGDDQDYNIHVTQSDYMAEYVRSNYKDYNVDKLFLDAYVQQTTPGGQRYPDAKRDLNLRVKEGALVLNYTGHGGEVGLAHESLLEVNDILSWDNVNNMPLFITATCEFTRYDDPTRVSAGEYAFLQNNGGMIALLTTSRLTFSGSNFTLNKYILQNLLKKINGEYPTLGDLNRISKVTAGSVSNNRNFVLLGDPALKLSYPEYSVKTLSINGQNIQQFDDTLKALSKVTISGQVESNGQIMNNFNGYVYPTVYDKAQVFSTIGNDNDSSPYNFELQKNIIYKGKTQVTNGTFSFTFIVPKDINYSIGSGRISYYAENGQIDANGYYDSILVGGSNNQAIADNDGPEIQLFMNDTLFQNGGLTDENPLFLAFLYDENGINTTGNGIGHDIVLTLDENTNQQALTLNNFYKSKTNSYQDGYIVYPLSNLAEGEHQVKLKAWDVLNNSNEATLSFVVANSEETIITSLMTFPNPFNDFTSFIFEHNQSGQNLNITIDIFNSYGKHVRSLQTKVVNSGYRVQSSDLKWSGTSQKGAKLSTGVYSYRVTLATDNGQKDSKSGKLVLLH